MAEPSDAIGSKEGRFNAFQRTMLHWNDLHPYNAVHVVRVPKVLDLARLRSAVNATLEVHGLAGLTLNLERGTYRYLGGPADCQLEIISDEYSSLCAEIERQLNTAFIQTERFSPFRFFVAPEHQSFFLGLTYFHPIADAESIVRLMQNIIDAYHQRAKPDSNSIDLYPARSDGLWRQSPSVLVRKLSALPALVRNMRTSCRPHYRDAQNLHNGFALFSLEPKLLPCLIETTKSWRITLNDLFLAFLMKALSPLAISRTRARRRRNLSVGCIVNTRKDLAVESERAFGLFLGSFIITHELPEDISLKDLARDIRQRTRAIKHARLYLGPPLEMSFGRWLLPLFSTERRKKLYQKHYPLWGGITNMNLNSLWPQPDGQASIDYFRAVSTGPVTPLVLSITTVREGINIGLTYRSTVFSTEQIGHVKGCFLENVQQLEPHP